MNIKQKGLTTIVLKLFLGGISGIHIYLGKCTLHDECVRFEMF